MPVDISSVRSEDLDTADLEDSFVEAGVDRSLVASLMSPGVHLLQGSRGTGKTMLLRVAGERLKSKPGVLPVFISFSRYLATTNPLGASSDFNPFENWVIAKLFLGLVQACELDTLAIANIPLAQFIARLEDHYRDPSVANRTENAAVLGVSEGDLFEFGRLDLIASRVKALLNNVGKTSVHFLLDEATQNFAEELQPSFFRIIRHLRDSAIATKVAVYPQATVYGRDFDVGHDAVTLPIERHVEETEGMEFFQEFVRRRTEGTDLGRTLSQARVQADFLIKASGGNPRWLLQLLGRVSETTSLNSTEVLGVCKEFVDTTLWPYLEGLKTRLVLKRRYVEAAISLAQVFTEDLREANSTRSSRPTCYVAVSKSREVPYRIRAALGLLEYSGLIYRRGPKRITSRENADAYLIHPALMVRENVFGVSLPVESLVRALSDPPKEQFKEYTKNSPRLLADSAAEEQPDICSHCGAVLAQDAKFCQRCGTPVESNSLYLDLRQTSSADLDLTPGVKERLTSDGRFPTVGNVLDATDDELDRIQYIGPLRVRLIRSAAEEFVAS